MRLGSEGRVEHFFGSLAQVFDGLVYPIAFVVEGERQFELILAG